MIFLRSSFAKNNISLTLYDLCPAIKSYNDRHLHLTKDIRFIQNNIRMMLSKTSSLKKDRRDLLGFVGRFAKSLFGVSTEEDTTILQKQIKQLYDSTVGQSEQLNTFIDDFLSYVVKDNKKFKLLQKATLLNNQAIRAISSLINSTITTEHEFTKIINVLHIYGSQYVDTLVDIQSHLRQTELAIQTLLQGYLPYYFVPPTELQNTLASIRSQLTRIGPFHLTHTEIGYYYHIQDITYKLHKDKLFVKIRIPVTSTTTAFTLYWIHSVPIPVSANQEDQTVIDIPEPYIAISLDKLFYMSLSESQYQFCTGNNLKRCKQALTMQEISYPSCALALFYDNPRSVAKLCSVSFLPKSQFHQSHVITVADNAYLTFTLDKNWIQTCPGKAPVEIKPCKLCIVRLPCACSLKGQTFFIPPTLQHCKYEPTPVVNHSLNLAALFQFYGDHQQIYNLSSKTFFAKPVLSEIPQIKVL